MKGSPIRRRRRTKHQERNEEYRGYVEWIHTQPCAACGTRQNIQAAHVGRGGVGMKHGSDAEVIPLCGPRPFGDEMWEGCHARHDQRKGTFSVDYYTRKHLHEWDDLQIAVHRGRFEARHVGAQVIPF